MTPRPKRPPNRRNDLLRPTTGRVRGAIFSMLGPGGPEGMRVLDLYAGTGALGLEALRRGAAFAELVESDRRRCAEIEVEAKRLKVDDRCKVHAASVEKSYSRLKGKYDLVFIDPPYALEPFDEVLVRLDDLVNDGATIFAEHGKRTELAEQYGRLRRNTTRTYGDTAISVFTAEPLSTDEEQ